jgi:outer membrane protein insertion porin family
LRNQSISIVLLAICGLFASFPVVAQTTAPAASPAATQEAIGGTRPALQGYRLGEIKITGIKSADAEFLRQNMGLVSGAVFDEALLAKGLAQVSKLYGIMGFAKFMYVVALEPDVARKVVNLTINIDEGRPFSVNRITITGNTTIPDELIRREILVREGQMFNSSALDLTLTRLNQLGLFEEIRPGDAQIEFAPSESKLDITIRLREKGR